MKLKPHYSYILLQTLKLAAAIFIFYIIAVAVSPNRYYTAVNGLKVFIPTLIIIYAYLFFFWYSALITVDDEKLVFTSKSGRKNHIEIYISDIKNVTVYQRFADKIFGVSRIKLDVKNMSHQTGTELPVVENYLVFLSADCQKLADALYNTKEDV